MVNKSSGGTVSVPTQGGHGLNKTSQEAINTVKEHIQSFAVVDSHYCRAQIKRKYLYPGLSINKMYQLYNEKCKDDNIQPVKQNIYSAIFNNDYNLVFLDRKRTSARHVLLSET